MLRIENDVIYMAKGDSATITVSLTDEDGEEYEMVSGDKLTMTVREAPTASSRIIFTVQSTSNIITITHNNTKDVEVGQYSADIQLETSLGQIHTIYPSFSIDDARLKSEKNWKNFWITPEVTR